MNANRGFVAGSRRKFNFDPLKDLRRDPLGQINPKYYVNS